MAVTIINPLSEFLPNVYVSRIILSYGNNSTKVRGDNPHIDIPPLTDEAWWGDGPAPHAITNPALVGLYGSETPQASLSSYSQTKAASQKNQSLSVRVDLVIKDVRKNQLQTSFFTSEQIKKFLNVKIIQTTDPSIAAAINSIEPTSLAISQYESIPNKSSSRTISINDLPSDINSYKSILDEAGNRIYDINFTTLFTIDNPNVNHLSIIAFPFIDKQMFENSFNPSIDLSEVPDLEKLLFGRKIFEPIIVNGELMTTATYYEDSAGNIWLGDVHMMFQVPNEDNTGFISVTADVLSNSDPFRQDQLVAVPMKGKTHAKGTHYENPYLKEVSVANTIIQDFRVKDEFENFDIDFSSVNKVFGDKTFTQKEFIEEKKANSITFFSFPFITKNINNHVKMIFTIDFEILARVSGKYGKVFGHLLNEDKKQILDASPIKSLCLVRKRVKSLTNTTYFDESLPEKVIATYKDLKVNPNGEFEKIFIDTPIMGEPGTRGRCFFAAVDKSLAKTNTGYYQYGIRYTVEDKITKILFSKVRQLKQSYKLLKKLYLIATEPLNYDLITDTFTEKFVKDEMAKYKAIVPAALTTFVIAHQTFFGGDLTKKEEMASLLINISAPTTGRPEGLLYIINMFENLLNNTASLLESQSLANTSTGESNTFNPADPKSSGKQFLVMGEYYFPTVYDADTDSNMGFDFLYFPTSDIKSKTITVKTNQTLGIASISYSDFEKRASLEIGKYFGQDSWNKQIFLKTEPKVLQPDPQSLSVERYQFFSPSLVKTRLNGVYENLRPKDKMINYESLNTIFLESLKARGYGSKVQSKISSKQLSNLTYVEKKHKHQLNEIINIKGGTYETSVTEGAQIYSLIEPISQILNYAEHSGEPTESENALENQQKKIIEEIVSAEPNYNDSLFFLANIDEKEDLSHFHSFLNALTKKYDAGKGQSQLTVEDLEKGIPNQYKQLMAFINPSDLNQSVDLLNILGFKQDIRELDTMVNKYGIWMNYFNLVEVEYLGGFWGNCVNFPMFASLTQKAYISIKESNFAVLCRMKFYQNEKFQIKYDSILAMPILEQYFILAPENYKAFKTFDSGTMLEVSKMFLAMNKKMNTLAKIPPEYLNNTLDGAKLAAKQKNASASAKLEGTTKLGSKLHIEGGFTGTPKTTPGGDLGGY